jgi:hypothetical protein
VIGLGFRIKSGYAISVVLTGSRHAPIAAARRVVELSDPKVAETRQPYHDGFGKEQDDEREISRRIEIVERCAKSAVGAFVRDARGGSPDGTTRASLVVGSIIDPRQVGNPHIRAHANEGRLFRTVVEDSLRACRVSCTIIVEKQLAATARAALGRDETAIAQTLAGFGKALGGPWRADEKAAAIGAWLALGGGH